MLRERFYAKVDITPGCWFWLGAWDHGFGYGRVKVLGRFRKAHRVAFELEVAPIPPSMCVLHRCDVPWCVNPDHLFLGTVAENNADKTRKGRASTVRLFGDSNGSRLHPERLARGATNGSRLHPERLARGEGHYRAVLFAERVREIRASAESNVVIAVRLGVGATTIAAVRARRTWKHIL